MQLGAAKYDLDDWRGESVVRDVRRAIKPPFGKIDAPDCGCPVYLNFHGNRVF